MTSITFIFHLWIGMAVFFLFLSLVLSKNLQRWTIAIGGSFLGLVTLWLGGKVFAGNSLHLNLWAIHGIGTLKINCDSLSAFFIIVSGLVFIPVSIFSYSYLRHYLQKVNLKLFSFLYFVFLESIILIPLSGDVFSFFIFWELMTISSYLLVTVEFKKAENRRAAFIMLAMSEAGALLAVVAFLLLAIKAGSMDFSVIKKASLTVSSTFRWTIFLLSFLGFSVKAGVIPFNSWLPLAHPVSPANISALLSGVILNLGIYGILRVNMDLLPLNFISAGVIMLVIGAFSAIVGILYAATDKDLKKLLAHSSIENMGIVVAGLGAGFIFLVSGKNMYASMAFIAAFYHLLNHSLYKSLLFLGAGTVDYKTGTRNLDKMGGLLKKMPWTGTFILLGVISISALPPFNGFVSEWLTLEVLLRSVELSSIGIKLFFVLAGVLLALTAGLAVTAFVRAYAMGFLGIARSKNVEKATDGGKTILLSLLLLSFLCLALGVLPTYVVPQLDKIAFSYTHQSGVKALIPPFFQPQLAKKELSDSFVKDFHNLGAQIGKGLFSVRSLVFIHRGGKKNPVVFVMSSSYFLITLLFSLLFLFIVVKIWLARGRKVIYKPLWAGGVRRFFPQMFYTASAFAQPVKVVFDNIFRPQVEEVRKHINGKFRVSIMRIAREVHLIDRLILVPFKKASLYIYKILAKIHNGRVNNYCGYVLLTLLFLLLCLFWIR